MNISEIGNAWEGRMLDARLPLRQWLGSSDHSCVYLTEIAGAGLQKAVVKLFPGNFFDRDLQLARWRSLAVLHSPNLLRLLDGGYSEIDGTPFFFVVTDFAEEDLSQILPQRALTADEVKELLPPLLDALEYLHKNGFVHGHIQPSNVMASGDHLKLPVERVYAIGEPRANTGPPSVYEAPEIATGGLTPAADVWSLGMFLIAALKQRPLALRGTPPSTPEIPADMPEPLRSIIGDCLAVNPKDRCTLAEVRAWLQPVKTPPVKAAQAVSAPPPKAQPALSSPPMRIVEAEQSPARAGTKRSGWRIGAPLAAVALIVALVLGQKLLSHKPPEPPAQPIVESAETKPAAAPTTSATADAAPPADPVLHRVVPEVSANTRRKIHGVIKVGVRVEVDPSGKVTAAKIVSPSSSHYFTNLAQMTAQHWEFAPPQENGNPLPSAWMLRFQFSRRSTEVYPSRVGQP